jgi:hypothetical protein
MDPHTNPLGSFLKWIKSQIVQPVPESDALCEFDCKINDCTFGRWVECERRLKRAADELMPEELVSTEHSSD